MSRARAFAAAGAALASLATAGLTGAEPTPLGGAPELVPTRAVDLTLSAGGWGVRHNRGFLTTARLRAELAVTPYLQLGASMVAGYAYVELDESSASEQYVRGNAALSARVLHTWPTAGPTRGTDLGIGATVMLPTSDAAEPTRVIAAELTGARFPAELDARFTRVEVSADVRLRRPGLSFRGGLGIQSVIEDRGPQIDAIRISAGIAAAFERRRWWWLATLHVATFSHDSGEDGRSDLELGLQHAGGFHVELCWPLGLQYGGTLSIGQRFE